MRALGKMTMKIFNALRVLIIAAAIQLSMHSLVLAAEWLPILRTANDTMQVYIAPESVIRNGQGLRVWLRTIVDKPPPKKPTLTIQENVWFNCDTMDFQIVSVSVYIGTDDTGELLQSQTWPFSKDGFIPIRPSSNKEEIAQFLCAKPRQTF